MGFRRAQGCLWPQLAEGFGGYMKERRDEGMAAGSGPLCHDLILLWLDWPWDEVARSLGFRV